MHAKRVIITPDSIRHDNDRVLSRIKAARQLVAIADGEGARARRADFLCPGCFRASLIGGAAMTQRPCGLCGDAIQSGSTNVDVLCRACARRSLLCRHCGADIDLKNRRSRDLTVLDRWPVDLECRTCGWRCCGEEQSLVAGDLCPSCEEYRPGEAGELQAIRPPVAP